MKSVSLLIGERDAMAAHGRTFDRLDPMTGEIASRAAAASAADARAAADAAARPLGQELTQPLAAQKLHPMMNAWMAVVHSRSSAANGRARIAGPSSTPG